MFVGPVNIVKDYHPWSAEFTDGTYVSRLTNPNETYAAVLNKLPLLYTFYIHFDWDQVVAVRVSDGLFYKGPKLGSTQHWSAHPSHLPYNKYTLYYTRQCSGAFIDSKINAVVTGYTIGWSTTLPDGTTARRLMKLDLQGEHTWET